MSAVPQVTLDSVDTIVSTLAKNACQARVTAGRIGHLARLEVCVEERSVDLDVLGLKADQAVGAVPGKGCPQFLESLVDLCLEFGHAFGPRQSRSAGKKIRSMLSKGQERVWSLTKFFSVDFSKYGSV